MKVYKGQKLTSLKMQKCSTDTATSWS